MLQNASEFPSATELLRRSTSRPGDCEGAKFSLLGGGGQRL